MKITPINLARDTYKEFDIDFRETNPMFSEPVAMLKCDKRIVQSVIEEFFQKLKNGKFSVSGAGRQIEWEEGWNETGFKPDPFNQNINIPFYFGKNEFLRVQEFSTQQRMNLLN